MSGSANQRSNQVLGRHRRGYYGMMLSDPRNAEADGINMATAVRQTTSWTVSDADGTIAIALSTTSTHLDAPDYNFAPAAYDTASATETATALVSDFNADPYASRFGIMSSSGAVVTLSALAAGTDYAFTATKTSSIMGSGTTVAAADPSAIPFGRAVLAYTIASSTGFRASLEGNGFPARFGARKVALPAASALSAQVSTITVAGTAEDSKTLQVSLRYLGARPYTEEISLSTATSATTTTIATAIAAAINKLTLMTATSSGAVVTATAAETGRPIEITVLEVDDSTATYTIANTTSAVDVENLLDGIAGYKPTMSDSETMGQVGSGFPAGESAVYLTEGSIIVACTETTTRNGAVWVGFGSGEEGKLFAAAGTDRHRWHRARWTGDYDGTVASVFLHPVS